MWMYLGTVLNLFGVHEEDDVLFACNLCLPYPESLCKPNFAEK